MAASATHREFLFGVTRGLCTERDGHQYLVAEQALAPHVQRITDAFAHWVEAAPDRTWMARRSQGQWVHLSYAEAWRQARCIGQALLDLKLSADRPLLILSENSLEHALLALAALIVGVPHCAVSPAYSLLSQDFSKLRHVVDTLTPGLVYASDASKFSPALKAVQPRNCVWVFDAATPGARTFAALLQTQATPEVDAAMAAVNGDTIAKFLFTSGSTQLPKAVINTQRMWCSNQQQIAQSIPAITEQAPVLVDWLPWNHTFGGNHNFGLVMFHGGTMYINDGKPVAALVGETLRNLREIAPTLYFDVPVGFELIAQAMQSDAVLRKNLLSRVQMFFYAGAALAQPVWDSLFASEEAEIGRRVVMGTGLGMTESSPFGLFVTNPHVRAGDLGLPTPGLELKLVKLGDKTEVRYRGPNITPGYWRNAQATAQAFDDEGFFCTGDAVKWIDECNIHLGLKFDGRVAEDFKLATGTFVSVGPLRAKIIAAFAPLIQDAVITGINRTEIGALLVPSLRLRTMSQLAPDAPIEDVLAEPAIVAHFQKALNGLAASATGSASRVSRMHVMSQALSIDHGEITDKGSVNQRAVLTQREGLVAALHEGSLPRTLCAQGP